MGCLVCHGTRLRSVVFSGLMAACSPPSQLQGYSRGLQRSVHSSYTSPDAASIGSATLLDVYCQCPMLRAPLQHITVAELYLADCNCTCHVVTVQRIFISKLFRYSIFHVLPIPFFCPIVYVMMMMAFPTATFFHMQSYAVMQVQLTIS